jgi:hypothetical protein
MESIDFSPDNQFLVLTDNSNLYIYAYNGANFVPNQTINYGRASYAKFSDSYRFLIVTMNNNFTNLYFYNNMTFQFNLGNTFN